MITRKLLIKFSLQIWKPFAFNFFWRKGIDTSVMEKRIERKTLKMTDDTSKWGFHE